MQMSLGASGQIGRELAVHLKRDFTSEIRLVSRRPQKVNDTDQLLAADLLDASQAARAGIRRPPRRVLHSNGVNMRTQDDTPRRSPSTRQNESFAVKSS